MNCDAITFEENAERLRVPWDNRRVRKDRFTFWFMSLWWIVWAPLTCFVTSLIFTKDSPVFFAVWCIFGWTGTLMVPLIFLKRLHVEWIELDSNEISWGARGPLAGKERRFLLHEVAEFSLGLYSDRRGEHESAVSLSVYRAPKRSGYMPRHLLGYWLAKEHQRAIFERVREFVLKHSVPLKVVIFGERERGD